MSCLVHAVCRDCYAGLVDVGKAKIEPDLTPIPPMLPYGVERGPFYELCCCCGNEKPQLWWWGREDVFKPHYANHNAAQTEMAAAINNSTEQLRHPIEPLGPTRRPLPLREPVIPS